LQISNNLRKISTFRVPKFKGDTLTGGDIIAEINCTFRSAAIAQILDSQACYNSLPTWSNIFASRLRKSMAKSDILVFLVTELESEMNCAKVLSWIQLTLRSSDVTTTRVMSYRAKVRRLQLLLIVLIQK